MGHRAAFLGVLTSCTTPVAILVLADAGKAPVCVVDGAVCDGGFCLDGGCISACSIADAGLILPTVAPAAQCLSCNPSASPTAWITLPEGTPCSSNDPYVLYALAGVLNPTITVEQGSVLDAGWPVAGACFTDFGSLPNHCSCMATGSSCSYGPRDAGWSIPCCGGECSKGVCCSRTSCQVQGECCDTGVCVLPDIGSTGLCSWDAGAPVAVYGVVVINQAVSRAWDCGDGHPFSQSVSAAFATLPVQDNRWCPSWGGSVCCMNSSFTGDFTPAGDPVTDGIITVAIANASSYLDDAGHQQVGPLVLTLVPADGSYEGFDAGLSGYEPFALWPGGAVATSASGGSVAWQAQTAWPEAPWSDAICHDFWGPTFSWDPSSANFDRVQMNLVYVDAYGAILVQCSALVDAGSITISKDIQSYLAATPNLSAQSLWLTGSRETRVLTDAGWVDIVLQSTAYRLP
jgi:hypothetical protein